MWFLNTALFGWLTAFSYLFIFPFLIACGVVEKKGTPKRTQLSVWGLSCVMTLIILVSFIKWR